MKLSKRQISIFASLILVACLVSSGITYAVLSFSTAIESGSMVDQASFTIFKDGSTYYAKNGMTGSIDYSGTNATQIIQNAIDSISAGDIWFDSSDTFLTSGSIFCKSYVNLKSMGATFSPSGDHVPIFVLGTASYVTIEGLRLIGRNIGNYGDVDERGIATSQNGWYEGLNGGNHITIQNIYASNWNLSKPIDIYESQNVQILDCEIGDSAGFGFGERLYNGIIANNIIYNWTKDYAIHAVGNHHENRYITITNNVIKGSGWWAGGGIDVIGSYCTISNNIIENVGAFDILLETNTDLGGTDTPHDVIISNNLGYGVQTDHGIRIESSSIDFNMSVLVIGNRMQGGLEMVKVSNITVIGNHFGGLANGALNQAIHNWGGGQNQTYLSNTIDTSYYAFFHNQTSDRISGSVIMNNIITCVALFYNDPIDTIVRNNVINGVWDELYP